MLFRTAVLICLLTVTTSLVHANTEAMLDEVSKLPLLTISESAQPDWLIARSKRPRASGDVM